MESVESQHQGRRALVSTLWRYFCDLVRFLVRYFSCLSFIGKRVESDPQNMDSMWDLFRALPLDIKGAVSLPEHACYERFALLSREKAKFEASSEASSSRAKSEDVPRQSMPRQINDYVYQFCSPPAGKRPSVELIFFHGLQFKGSHETHLTTWLSANESELWLTWILEDIPDARILIISYDAHTKRAPKQGIMDMYVTTENLLQCLIGGEARVGQDGCPVVMVGHCIGGLVMKQLCVYAAEKLGLKSNKPDDRMQTFLNNIKGLFFYASPNHGTRLADLTKEKGALFQDATTLNEKASRQKSDFSELRDDKGWRTFGIGEAHEVTLGSFRGLVVPEASARCDVDGFYTAGADHFNVCRPESKISSNFSLLLNFIFAVVKQDQHRQAPKIALKEAVGVEEQVEAVLQLLKRTVRVGIVGIGGIGKTTLAKSVYDTTSRNFEYTCFLDTVKLQFTLRNVKKGELRDKIIGSLLHKERKVNKEDFRWGDLKGKKVLLVLDDVEDESQVMVMTEEDGFSDDSRVIVTSRNQDFLRPEGFKFFSAKCLNPEASKRLFCFHAFNQTTPANGYDDRVAKFTKKCGGLPLALKVAGRFVYGRPPKLWDDAFLKLKTAKPFNGNAEDGLWSILSASFDSLAEEEREMFLDIAKCFHGEKLDDVKEVWRTCGWAADVGWTNLLEKGLVTETKKYSYPSYDGDEVTHIEMHEMLRDLGCMRACPRSQNNSGHSRVCHFASENEGRIWPFTNEEKPKAEVLKIEDYWNDGPVSRNEIDELRKLEKLRVLWIRGGNLYGDCHLFPKELVYVSLRNLAYWHDSYRPAEEQNRTLLYLKLQGCRMKTLPRSLGQLRALQSLTIEDCQQLETLPPCIGQLDALEYLTIRTCNNISLPNTPWQLKSLKHLVIVKYLSLGILRAVIGQMRALEYLEISQPQPGAEPVSCPNRLGQLEGLKHLHLETEYFAEDFQKNLVKLQRLEYLKVAPSISTSPYWLPDSPIGLGQLQALKSLILDKVTSNNLEDLPASLEYLEIITRYDLPAVNLPSTIGGLHTLKRLKVQDLSVFPDSLCELQSLEYLHITSKVIDLLPDNLGNLRGLKHLSLYCEKLKAVPDSIGELQALEDFELYYCESLETLPDTIGELRALKSFTVVAGGLQFLPDTIGGLKVLETLSLDGCPSLEALPDALGLLPALRELRLERCHNILALPHTVGHLQSLRTLVIRYCQDLKTFTDILSKLKYLERLEIKWCASLERLPESLYSGIKYHDVTQVKEEESEWEEESECEDEEGK